MNFDGKLCWRVPMIQYPIAQRTKKSILACNPIHIWKHTQYIHILTTWNRMTNFDFGLFPLCNNNAETKNNSKIRHPCRLFVVMKQLRCNYFIFLLSFLLFLDICMFSNLFTNTFFDDFISNAAMVFIMCLSGAPNGSFYQSEFWFLVLFFFFFVSTFWLFLVYHRCLAFISIKCL